MESNIDTLCEILDILALKPLHYNKELPSYNKYFMIQMAHLDDF